MVRLTEACLTQRQALGASRAALRRVRFRSGVWRCWRRPEIRPMTRGAVSSTVSPASHRRSSPSAGARARARRRSRRAGLVRLTIALIVLALLVWGGAHVAHAADGSERLTGTVHLVRPGDTLWTVVQAQYGSQQYDLRRLVYLVQHENHLSGADLTPGQRLLLPYVE
jgi:hypothetical protein